MAKKVKRTLSKAQCSTAGRNLAKKKNSASGYALACGCQKTCKTGALKTGNIKKRGKKTKGKGYSTKGRTKPIMKRKRGRPKKKNP